MAIFFEFWRLLIGCSVESTNQKSPKLKKVGQKSKNLTNFLECGEEEGGASESSSSSAESGFSTDAENANHETEAETEENNQLNIPSNEDIMTASTTTIKNEPVVDDDDDTMETMAGDEPSEDQNNDCEMQPVRKN